MKVVFSKNISKKENITDNIKLSIIKFLSKGVFVRIKGDSLPKNSQLIKIYATMVDGARRIVFLVDSNSENMFFLFFRSKNDKIGKNITIKNPEFKIALHKYLRILKEDIEKGECRVFEVDVPRNQ